MDATQWSYLLVAVGLLGFIVTGRKLWWGWYVNIGCQALWFTYAVLTHQWGFLLGAIVYTLVFSWNAWQWTREHYQPTWIGESETVNLTNIKAWKAKEAAEKFEKIIGHPPITVYKVLGARHQKVEFEE